MSEHSQNIEALSAEVGNTLDINIPAKISYEEMVILLGSHINYLVDKNFNGLLQLLYRIDIPENKLRDHLATDDTGHSGKIIAEMMIERIQQKMETRKKFSKPAADIPEEDKW